MFQISEVQESPAFNRRRSFLTLRPPLAIAFSADGGTPRSYAALLEGQRYRRSDGSSKGADPINTIADTERPTCFPKHFLNWNDVTKHQAIGTCFLAVIVVAVLHLLFICLFDLNLSNSLVGMAFGLGAFVGVFITAIGVYVKQTLFASIIGAFFCYVFTIGHIVVWSGIPLKWIY